MCSISFNIFVFTLPVRVRRGFNLKEAPTASPLLGSYVFLRQGKYLGC